MKGENQYDNEYLIFFHNFHLLVFTQLAPAREKRIIKFAILREGI